MELELERFLENQTEMLCNLTITDSICIDTLRDICERYCELKKLRVADVSESVCDCGNFSVEAYSPCCSLSCWLEKYE